MSGGRMTPSRSRPRGFALPLVMLLALVGTIAATMIIEFQASARLGEMRQIETCRAHHEQQGLGELIEMWSTFGHAPPIEGDRKIGFTIRGERNEFYEVEIGDAQAQLLDSPSALMRADPYVAECYRRAVEMVRAAQTRPDQFLRTRGPAAVNFKSASPEVLEALARSINDGAEAKRFARLVVDARNDRKLDSMAALKLLINEAGITEAEEAATLAAFFVGDSMLRQVEVRIRDPIRGTTSRHSGLILGEVKPGGQSASRWAFLTWRRVEE